MLTRSLVLVSLTFALIASAEPPGDCQSAIDADLAVGAVLDTKRNELDPKRIWLKLDISGREASVLYDCADGYHLRSSIVEFETLAKATRHFDARRDDLLRVEGEPDYGIDDVSRDYPGAFAALKQLRLVKVLREYRWEENDRLVTISLSDEESDGWTVIEILGEPSGARRRITSP